MDDANGTYTVKIGDITLKDGDYLANNATAVTTTKPSGGYAYYKDGVLTLNNFVAAKLVRYYERYLEVELIGENKIGAIADYYYWDTTSNDYFTGLEFFGDGDLEFDEYYDDPCCNVSVNGDVFFNGSGDILLDAEFCCFQYTDNVIINDGYVYCYCSQFCVFGDDTNITVNGGKLKMYDGGSWYDYFICDGDLLIYAGSVYVSTDSGKTELADCVPWDGVTDLNTYECVWILSARDVYVGGVGMYDGDYLAVGATATQTTKPSCGYAYYKNGKLTLNNYSYAGEGYLNSSSGYYAVIYSNNDLTLELIGNNTLTQTDWNSDMIYVDGANLTVGGDGKLTGTSEGYALYADKDITINGGTVEVSTYHASILSYGEVIINDGDITAESEYSAAIYSYYDDVTINGGNVTAIGGFKAISCALDRFSVAEGMNIQASTTEDGALGEYVSANHDSYKKIVVKTATSTVLLGDVNLDGAVNAVDSNLLKRSIAGEYYIDSASDNAKAADINGDGQINAVDSNLLKRTIAGEYQP